MGGLTDQLEITAAVIPALTDQVRLDVSVFADRLSDAVEVIATISPRVTDAMLLATVIQNQALEAAAQSVLLAPVVEVTWLS